MVKWYKPTSGGQTSYIQRSVSAIRSGLSLIVKPTLQIVLLVVFLQYFGLPAISRFRAGETITVSRKQATGGIMPPTITVVPTNPDTDMGWRGNTSVYPEIIQHFCDNNTKIDECIESNTFNQTEVLKDVFLGFTSWRSLMAVDSIWREDFTDSWYGRAYTVNVSRPIGPDDDKSQLFVALGYNLDYLVVLHDPSYLPCVLIENPTLLPNIMLPISPNKTESHYYRFGLTAVEELDLPADPCNPDPLWSKQVSNPTCFNGFLRYIPPPPQPPSRKKRLNVGQIRLKVGRVGK
jgi:hypothetical protein